MRLSPCVDRGLGRKSRRLPLIAARRYDMPSNADNSKLTAAVAATVFGWRSVRKREGTLIGKRQDKAGRWRTAKVPDYANDIRQSYAIDERMKQLGHTARYLKELERMTKAKKLPTEWATPEQRSKAALKALSK